MSAIPNSERPGSESNIATHRAREMASRIRQILVSQGRWAVITDTPIGTSRGLLPKDERTHTAHMVRVQGRETEENRIGTVRILFFYGGETLVIVSQPTSTGYQFTGLGVDKWISEWFSKGH